MPAKLGPTGYGWVHTQFSKSSVYNNKNYEAPMNWVRLPGGDIPPKRYFALGEAHE
jgi:hypothetical protein